MARLRNQFAGAVSYLGRRFSDTILCISYALSISVRMLSRQSLVVGESQLWARPRYRTAQRELLPIWDHG